MLYRGFLTDNAKKFSKLANQEDARVAILTDGDMTGRAIAGEVSTIPRIGISVDTLKKLEIPIEDVAEDLDKDSPHKNSARKLYYQGLILEEDWEFLNSNEHGRRVEIDNVIGYVGTERFWNEFILPSFAKLFGEVNYNLSLNRTEYVILPELTILNELARKKGIEAATDTVKKIESEYASYDIASHGFISDITLEEQKIEKRVMKRELDDKNIQWLSERLESITEEFNQRINSTLIIENEDKNERNEDIDDPEYDEINIDDNTKDIISENHTRTDLKEQ